LGRTGTATRLRIVAQVHQPPGVKPLRVRFFVDGAAVGTADSGPPFSVEWTDENPFERREIIAELDDSTGHTERDTVVLPAFEITDVSEVTSVLVEAGVYDKNGRFVSNLDPSELVVKENGVPQNLDLVSRESLPSTLVLLVDSSQSMSRQMDFVRRAAAKLAGGLRPQDRVVVAPFNAHVRAITGPTADAATITQAITAISSTGGTAILDALLDATDLVRGAEGRRAIILITDGYDENSMAKVEEVLEKAEAAQVTIYVVGIGGVAGISLKGEIMLRRLADETGGRVFFPPREIDLVPISETVSTDSHSRYLITYTPKDQKKDGTWRNIAVEAPTGYKVRARAGYLAPSPPPIRPALEFTVTDTTHAFVDVNADQLDVIEDGVPQTIDTFQEAVDPVSIVMALDSSGSMKKSAEGVQQAARDFVSTVRSEDSLALITFADKPLFAHTLATNRQWTLDAIGQYKPSGGTALYDALWNSLMHLKGVPGRHAVVVLTDGKDENNPGTAPGSAHTLDEVLDLLKTSGAMMFPIGLGTKVEHGILERLAAESGGEAYFPSDTSVLSDEFRRVVENLRRRFVVSYTSTNSAHDGGWRSVEIRAHDENLSVATRGGYFAPEK
ncbi:MAG TPA: VWA domain-containing protein, partial [Vicinamibacterales bacterium]|nr:VWA domain-containing protein [Vicinamibacterales bacterium]